MEKLIAYLILKKGLLIGIIASIIKILLAIRKGNFRWVVFLVDTPLAIIISCLSRQVIDLTEIAIYWKISWTLFFALNAFVIANTVTDAKKIEALFDKYLKLK